MDFVFAPTSTIFYVLAPIVAVALLAALLAMRLGRWPAWKAFLIPVPILVVCAFIAHLARQPHHLIVDEIGLRADDHGGVAVPWAAVRRARVVVDVWSSPDRPARRTGGTADGPYRSGWWTLADGRGAYLMMERSDRALVLEDDATTYLLAPRDLDRLVAEVGRHVAITGVRPVTAP
jgi:hypothetical protein